MKKACLLAAGILLVWQASVVAQMLPPRLIVVEQGKKLPMRTASVQIETRIHGFLAHTSMTMVFANPSARALAGDLYFPLPQGATVSGYALDVQGAMVDGVVVEKDKARQVFEEVVRQGIDPGLVEYTKGNHFKTRVFPIPPNGTRTVRVSWVNQIQLRDGRGVYLLPLNFKGALDEFSMRVEVVKPVEAPSVTAEGVHGLRFTPWREAFVAEATRRKEPVVGQLRVELPGIERQPVVMEQAADGKVYFLVRDTPPVPAAAGDPPPPGQITLYWDASASRAKSGHPRMLGLLEQYITALDAALTVELVVFRDQAEPARVIALKKGQPGPLLEALRGVPYDGATRLDNLPTPHKDSRALWLVSDGLATLGAERFAHGGIPAWLFAGESGANHAWLMGLAVATGGGYFNLAAMDDPAVLRGLRGASFRFAGYEGPAGALEAIHPAPGMPLRGGVFSLAGVWLGKPPGRGRDSLTLLYGGAPGGEAPTRVKVPLPTGTPPTGELVRLAWAQHRLEQLLAAPRENAVAITQLGMEHGLVTPGTSLIVLETLDQYVRYEIEPPATLPKMRAGYHARVAAREKTRKAAKDDKLSYLQALWEKRVQWWETPFTYPKDFRYRHPKGKKQEEGAPAPRNGRAQESLEDSPMLLNQAREEESAGDAGVMDRMRGADSNAPLRRFSPNAEKKKDEAAPAPSTRITAWNPKTPYLDALGKAKPAERYAKYLELRETHGDSPAFFVDVGDYFLKQKDTKLALRIWSNIAEMELENPRLLRVLAHRLDQAGYLELAALVFEEVLTMRPEEPHSYRDLGLLLARQKAYPRAMDLLNQVVMGTWDGRFREIEMIALMELNAIIPQAKAAGVRGIPLHPSLIHPMELDVRVVLSWDADLTDMDLHVVEPSTEQAYYGHRNTTIGGLVSQDFTQGYGPEEYLLRRAMPGGYQVLVNYFSDSAPSLTGSVTLRVDVYTNWGRPGQRHEVQSVRLRGNKETLHVAELEF